MTKSRIILILFISIFLISCGGGESGDSSVSNTNNTSATTDSNSTTNNSSSGSSNGSTNTAYNWSEDVIGYEMQFIVKRDDNASPTGIPLESVVVYEFSKDGAVKGTNPVSGNVYYPQSYAYTVVNNVAIIKLTYSSSTYEIYELTPTSPTTGTYYYTGNAGDSRGDMHNYGTYEILSDGSEKTLTYTTSTKKVTFAWKPLLDSSYYKLSEDVDGDSGLSVIKDNIKENNITIDTNTFQYDYRAQPVDSFYTVESCTTDDVCTQYNKIDKPDVLNDGVGVLEGEEDRFGTKTIMSASGNIMITHSYYSTQVPSNIGSGFASATNYIQYTYRANKESKEYWTKIDTKDLLTANVRTITLSDDGSRYTMIDIDRNASVYELENNVWVKKVSLPVEPTGVIASTLISGDGNTVVINYSIHAVSGLYEMRTKVYYYSNNVWTEQNIPTLNFRSGNYGDVCDISYDGNTLLLGKDLYTSSELAYGGIYYYQRVGSTWEYKGHIIKKDDISDIKLSNDGQKAVYTLRIGSGSSSYSEVYLMLKDNLDEWSEEMIVRRYGLEAYLSLSFSGDSNTLAVANRADRSKSEDDAINYGNINDGAYSLSHTSNQGGIEVYSIDYSNNTATLMAHLKAKKTSKGQDASPSNDFAEYVSIDNNGITIVTSAYIIAEAIYTY